MTSHSDQLVPLSISDTAIRQDSDGRYCINDLHKAAGGEKRHQPSNWLQLQQSCELIEELANPLIFSVPGIPGTDRINNLAPVSVIRSLAEQQGTFVVKELVYAYAMWISPKFHIRVIRAFDALVSGDTAKAEAIARPDSTLIASEQQTLTEIVHLKVAGLADNVKGKVLAEIWSRIHNKFRVAKYDQLPRTQLAEVILYVTKMELRVKDAVKDTRPQLDLSEPVAPEYLNTADMHGLGRMVWSVTNRFRYAGSAAQSAWKALRKATGVPAPQKFEVRHIPILAAEIRRLYAAVTAYEDMVREVEQKLIKQIFRVGNEIDPMLAEMHSHLEQVAADDLAGVNKRLAAWQEKEISLFHTRNSHNMLGLSATEPTVTH